MRKSFTYEDRRYFIRCDSEVDFERKKLLKIQAINGDRKVVRKNMTVSDWAADWVETYRPDVSAKWKKNIALMVDRFCDQYGQYQVKRITQKNIQVYINQLSGMSEVTQKKVKTILYSFFQTAADNGLTLSNPVRNVKMPRHKKAKTRRSVTDMERTALISVAKWHDFGPYVMIMMCCGLRTMEVAALDGRDVDMKNGVIHVRATVKYDGSVGAPKSESGLRTVPIPELLNEYLDGIEAEPFAPYLTTRKGNRFTQSATRKAWIRFRTEMGKEMKKANPLADTGDLVMYDLRHTFCTDLQAVGVPINVARELMGHSSIAITSKIYTHHSDESIEDARNRLNAACHPRATNPETVAK